MNLANHFLVAMPGMQDPLFRQSVVYLCEHNDEGAMGIIINAPINISIAGMLEQVDITPELPRLNETSLEQPVLNGGPVAEDRGFVLHRPKDSYQSSIDMTPAISMTTSRDILGVLGTEAAPSNFIVALGYAGWEAGQLETELAENSWLTVEADPDIIFDTPIDERWRTAINKLGIDASQLSPDAGHG